MRNPHKVQERVFLDLLSLGKRAKFGQQFSFSEFINAEQFRARVPMHTYEQLFPYIERAMKGEKDVLWPGEVLRFSKSSGTTNARSKFIPITQQNLRQNHYRAGKDMLAVYAHTYPKTKLFKGHNLSLGGSLEDNILNPGSVQGDISAILMNYLPFWAEWRRAPRLEVALLPEFEEKLERMAKEIIADDIRALSGVPTWMVVLLERVLQLTGKATAAEVWPGLEAFFHGAVAFDPYRSTFAKLIGKPINYLELYNASEGFFGIQETEEPNEMLLLLDHGVYYEFVPLAEVHQEQPKAVALHEVEVGPTYEIVISTNSGLWRYRIGDTIRFTSATPYRFKISGRTKQFINAFGEELMVQNAEAAIAKVSLATGAEVANFTAAPVYLEAGKKGRHEWVVEFAVAPADAAAFAAQLDAELRQLNADYDAKRYHDLALLPLQLHVAPSGTFYRWMQQRGKLGGQHKVPRLANERKWVEEVLQLLYV